MCRRKEAHQSRDIARQMRFVPQHILLGYSGLVQIPIRFST